MEKFWRKLKGLYDLNPILFGLLLSLDLLIILALIMYLF